MTLISKLDSAEHNVSTLLKSLEIDTTEALLARGASYQDRAQLMQATQLDEWQLLPWIGRADLERINGIGWEYANLIADAAKILSVQDLARAEADALLAQMSSHNEIDQHVKRLPTLNQVAEWIQEAASMETLITYAPAGEVM